MRNPVFASIFFSKLSLFKNSVAQRFRKKLLILIHLSPKLFPLHNCRPKFFHQGVSKLKVVLHLKKIFQLKNYPIRSLRQIHISLRMLKKFLILNHSILTHIFHTNYKLDFFHQGRNRQIFRRREALDLGSDWFSFLRWNFFFSKIPKSYY